MHDQVNFSFKVIIVDTVSFPLLQLPLLANPSGDILEIFHIKHNLVANQISRFSFSSRNSKADDKKEKKEAAGVAGGKAGQDKKVSVPWALEILPDHGWGSVGQVLFQSGYLMNPGPEALQSWILLGNLVSHVEIGQVLGKVEVTNRVQELDHGNVGPGQLGTHEVVTAPFGQKVVNVVEKVGDSLGKVSLAIGSLSMMMN